MQGGACFDATGAYRYLLWRQWQDGLPRLVFIMLNPSRADAEVNDPTIRRCIGYAQSWGYGSLEVVNLFALMATHPGLLGQAKDPVGAECDEYILQAVKHADRVVLAWGNWGKLYGRDQAVLNLLLPYPLYCLGCNQSGQPRHPLYLKRTLQPVSYVPTPLRSSRTNLS